MLDRIVAFLDQRKAPDGESADPFSVKQVAAAALMVEGARLDRDFDESERAAMERVTRMRKADVGGNDGVGTVLSAQRRN